MKMTLDIGEKLVLFLTAAAMFFDACVYTPDRAPYIAGALMSLLPLYDTDD